jgi:hypothetical protein
MLKRSQQIELVSQFVFNLDRSAIRRTCGARTDTDRSYGPVALGSIVVDFIDRNVRNVVTTLTPFDCLKRAISQLFERQQGLWHVRLFPHYRSAKSLEQKWRLRGVAAEILIRLG